MMNQGQFAAITALLTEIRDLLKAQNEKPTIIRNFDGYKTVDIAHTVRNELIRVFEEADRIPPKQADATQPAKRRGRQKKVSA